MQKMSEHFAGALRIGIMECLVPYVARALEGPGEARLALKVSIGDTGTLVDKLRRNEIDALLGFSVPRLAELRIHDERSYELGVVYSARLGPQGEPPFRIEDCLGLPLCLPDANLAVWPRLDAEIYRVHAEPQIVLRTNSIALITDYVAAGKGISFLNWVDVAAGVAGGRLLFGKLDNRRLTEKLYLCGATTTPLGSLQLERARALFRQLPASP